MCIDLETLAEVLGSNSTAALTFNDPTTVREVLQSLAAKPHVMAASLYRSDGLHLRLVCPESCAGAVFLSLASTQRRAF